MQYPFHMLRLPEKEHRPVKLVPALGDWECDGEWEIAPVARLLAPYIIISAPKRLIWVWRTFRLRFDCSKVRNDRPPPPASAVGRPWHHKLQTDSRLPLQRRQLRSEGDSDSIGRRASATASFFDANPMGFSFTASAKGVCQCRVESSRVRIRVRVGLDYSGPGSTEIGCHLCSIRLC